MVKVSVADGRLLVDPAVFGVVEEIAADAGVAVRDFWKRMDELIAQFGPRNKVSTLRQADRGREIEAGR